MDDDLGRSASGTVARPGFDRLVALLCAGKVGAVLCFDASRLARNGRDWHHLLELCGLVEARVIDHDGVYNPCRPNDRLLLGMKGSISEFELDVLRARMLDAARSKARRGELRLSVPFGYHLASGGGAWTGPRSASARRNPIYIRALPRAWKRASGAAVDDERSNPLSAAVG
ncbi:recombinase family protein [Rhizobium leguminosarum]|uniref:recombinase family protein n=1 Tax=Rhizobium leguminosarum TaxID=384 RepID=UPI0028C3FF1F|nr:recombinase family protein [Rhizobium leguminosarum]